MNDKIKLNDFYDLKIKTTWQLIQRFYSTIAKKFDITQAIGFILISIDKDGNTPKNIANRVGVEFRSLSRILKEMEEKGLLYKRQDDNDKRKIIYHLTKEGINARKHASNIILDFNLKLEESFSEDEKKCIKSILAKVEKLTKPTIANEF